MKMKSIIATSVLASSLMLVGCETDSSYTAPSTSTNTATSAEAEPTGPVTEKGEFEAWRVRDQAEANQVCPELAKSLTGTWDGKWRTSRPTEKSFCTLGPLKTRTFDTAVSLLGSQSQAAAICPAAATAASGEWNGQWTNQPRPKLPDAESVCGVSAPVYTSRPLKAGPIWNQADAQTKCPALAEESGGTWNGAWWTTVEGEMSVCEIDS